MLKKLIEKLAGTPSFTNDPSPASTPKQTRGAASQDPFRTPLNLENVTVIPREQHSVSRKAISSNALNVLYKLDQDGYQAFLVGGSVRDLLMGEKPKDFDIATNATPEQLKKLFRNARIIGRRFKIVHLRFGREIIEVTTFRAHHSADPTLQAQDTNAQLKHMDSAYSSEGMILRDNVFGDISEDALRRDFTVNALYYTIKDFKILDFSTGIDDINNKLIRVIGEPSIRYKEDPVRMLRAIRFSAKLSFEIEHQSRQPIEELASTLSSISPARLFDETLKLLSSGFGEKSFELLTESRLGEHLFPATIKCIKQADSPENRLLSLALRNTDSRIADGKSVTPAFLFAALLWPVIVNDLKKISETSDYNLSDLQAIANKVINSQLQFTAIPKRFTFASREIWELQIRLQKRNKRSAIGAFQHPRFRAGYDFLLLREESGEPLQGLGQWWTTFQLNDAIGQTEMINALGVSGKKRRRKQRKTTGKKQ